LPCKPHHDVIAQAAGAEDFGEERPQEEAQEEETLDLRRVRCVGGGEHGDDGEDPPVPGEAVYSNRDDHDRIFEGEDEADD